MSKLQAPQKRERSLIERPSSAGTVESGRHGLDSGRQTGGYLGSCQAAQSSPRATMSAQDISQASRVKTWRQPVASVRGLLPFQMGEQQPNDWVIRRQCRTEEGGPSWIKGDGSPGGC